MASYTTSYSYSDPLDRVTLISQPSVNAGNQFAYANTSIQYPDTYWTRVFRDKDTTNDRALEEQMVYDGFGHLTEHRQITDSNHFVGIDYTYDALGRPNCTMNPSSTQISPWQPDGLGYVNCEAYDSIRRVSAVTDPLSKTTRSVTDALGRVTAVVVSGNGFGALAGSSSNAAYDPPLEGYGQALRLVGQNTDAEYASWESSQRAIARSGGDVNDLRLTRSFGYFVRPGGPTDFNNLFRGQANASFLGQAGKFACDAIGSGYLPNFELDAGAGAYALVSAALGRKPFSSLTGLLFSDASAASQRSAGLATAGLPKLKRYRVFSAICLTVSLLSGCAKPEVFPPRP